MVTPEQKAYFDTFGFIYLPKLFSADEMEAITREADGLFERDREGRPFGERQNIQEFVEKGPVMTRLADDDRVYGVVEALLGPDFVWNGSEGNVTNEPMHPWHTDRPGEPHAATYSFHFYFDAVRADTGCLRVIPGSHKPPLYDDLEVVNHQKSGSTMAALGVAGAEMPGIALESDPGDIMFFHQKIYHGVYGGWRGRRYMKLRFAARPETDEQIASLMRYNSRGRVYRPDEAFLNSDSPRIRAMVDPLLALAARTSGWIESGKFQPRPSGY